MTDGQFSSTHPKNPPTSEDERFLWLRLLRSRLVGVATFYRLMTEYGTVGKALEALPEIAAQAGVSNYTICPEAVIQKEMQAGTQMGARLLCYGAQDYPKSLLDLSDAPPVLWALGDIDLLHREKIALVGARNASSLGCRMARHLARDLGEVQQVIVSGLARGIDVAAHEASLTTGTIAVFGGGLDVIYPEDNRELAKQIAAKGVILAEQPFGLAPQARHFPARNRIISGLSRATVVVEAAAKSGSLITARNALDQGREVFAVPGHPIDARAGGCNHLIRDGATLIRNASDVIEALRLPEPAQKSLPLPDTPKLPPKEKLQRTAKLHQEILRRVGPSPMAEDQLISDLKSSARVLAPVLATLELHGKILRRAGGLLSKVQ